MNHDLRSAKGHPDGVGASRVGVLVRTRAALQPRSIRVRREATQPENLLISGRVVKDGAARKHPVRVVAARNPCAGSSLGKILVSTLAGERRRGKLVAGPLVIPCVLGRTGTTMSKREGDGATPIGRWRMVALGWRPDRSPRPASGLPIRPLTPRDGWCDAPGSARYNQPVTLPCPEGHEELWRTDGLYDFVVVLDYNLRYPARGRGSAIFLHVAAPDGHPTAGCVAITRDALRRLLPRRGPRCRLDIRS